MAFYKKPSLWVDLFNNDRVGVTTSFQYGGGRLKGDYTEFTEEDFWKCSDAMLEYCDYRPDFISVITEENVDNLKNVELAKYMSGNKIPQVAYIIFGEKKRQVLIEIKLCNGKQ